MKNMSKSEQPTASISGDIYAQQLSGFTQNGAENQKNIEQEVFTQITTLDKCGEQKSMSEKTAEDCIVFYSCQPGTGNGVYSLDT